MVVNSALRRLGREPRLGSLLLRQDSLKFISDIAAGTSGHARIAAAFAPAGVRRTRTEPGPRRGARGALTPTGAAARAHEGETRKAESEQDYVCVKFSSAPIVRDWRSKDGQVIIGFDADDFHRANPGRSCRAPAGGIRVTHHDLMPGTNYRATPASTGAVAAMDGGVRLLGKE